MISKYELRAWRNLAIAFAFAGAAEPFKKHLFVFGALETASLIYLAIAWVNLMRPWSK